MTPEDLFRQARRGGEDAATRPGASAAAIGRSVLAAADDSVRQLRIIEPPELRPACTRGCSWCCYGGRVDVTVPEVAAIVDRVREFSPDDRATVLARAREQAALVRTKGSRATWRHRMPCPLLDEAASECRVYDERPLSCRGWASTDAGACEESHRIGGDADPDVPHNGAQRLACFNVGEGAGAALKRRGFETAAFELSTALEAALAADLVETWLRRKPSAPEVVITFGTRLATADEKRHRRNQQKARRRKRETRKG